MFGPVRTIILAATLYLPMALFVWFLFAQAVVQPVLYLAKFILTTWMPDVFVGVQTNKYVFEWITTLPVDAATIAAAGGKAVGATVDTNPMIYGYGLPILAGLVLATPLTTKNRLKQIAIAAVVVWLVQTNGVVWEAIKHVGLEGGPTGFSLITGHGVTPNMLAFLYQLAYLILTPLTPILLWIVMNRNFIEQLLQVESLDEIDDDTDQKNKEKTIAPASSETP
jgi:hypothetical protein